MDLVNQIVKLRKKYDGHIDDVLAEGDVSIPPERKVAAIELLLNEFSADLAALRTGGYE